MGAFSKMHRFLSSLCILVDGSDNQEMTEYLLCLLLGFVLVIVPVTSLDTLMIDDSFKRAADRLDARYLLRMMSLAVRRIE